MISLTCPKFGFSFFSRSVLKGLCWSDSNVNVEWFLGIVYGVSCIRYICVVRRISFFVVCIKLLLIKKGRRFDSDDAPDHVLCFQNSDFFTLMKEDDFVAGF